MIEEATTGWMPVSERPVRIGWYDLRDLVSGKTWRAWYDGTTGNWAGFGKSNEWRGLTENHRETEARRLWEGTLAASARMTRSRISTAATTAYEVWRQNRATSKNDEVWECNDGRKMLVGEMHIDHLRNAIRMILRAKRRQDRMKALASAMPRRA